jgi:hypothetical protein
LRVKSDLHKCPTIRNKARRNEEARMPHQNEDKGELKRTTESWGKL